MRLFAISIPSEPVDSQIFDQLATLIDPPGRDRLKRFRLPIDATCSLVARLTVTWYLYTNGLLPAKELPVFGRKGKGKPVLSTPSLDPRLEFNNTHEGSYVLFAAFRSASPLACVGIDIMKHPEDPLATQEGISEQLTLHEKLSLAVPLTDRERSQWLTRMWSVKEGFTKAVGEGITFGLERIEVELGDEREEKVKAVRIDGRDADEIGWEWKVGDLGDEYGWALWWRGVDSEGKQGLKIEHVSWEGFSGPLLELANKITSNT